MLPVNLNPMVPISPGDLARLKSLVRKTLSSARRINSKTMASQSVVFDGNMKNVAIGDINLTINVSSKIVDNLHQVKNIVDKLAIAPPGSIPRRQNSQEQARLPLTLAADSLNMAEVKARVIRMALAKHAWNRTHAAEELGVSVRGLRDWINKYGLREE